jgi:two-component system response regulator FixJ
MDSRPVYVVDDDTGVLKSTEFLLHSLGFECDCFATARAFLAAVESLAPGCILTDLRMPDVNGIELLRALTTRSISWPLVLMTSENGPGAADRAAKAGFCAYLRKPFTADELCATLQRCSSMFDRDRS